MLDLPAVPNNCIKPKYLNIHFHPFLRPRSRNMFFCPVKSRLDLLQNHWFPYLYELRVSPIHASPKTLGLLVGNLRYSRSTVVFSRHSVLRNGLTLARL